MLTSSPDARRPGNDAKVVSNVTWGGFEITLISLANKPRARLRSTPQRIGQKLTQEETQEEAFARNPPR